MKKSILLITLVFLCNLVSSSVTTKKVKGETYDFIVDVVNATAYKVNIQFQNDTQGRSVTGKTSVFARNTKSLEKHVRIPADDSWRYYLNNQFQYIKFSMSTNLFDLGDDETDKDFKPLLLGKITHFMNVWGSASATLHRVLQNNDKDIEITSTHQLLTINNIKTIWMIIQIKPITKDAVTILEKIQNPAIYKMYVKFPNQEKKFCCWIGS